MQRVSTNATLFFKFFLPIFWIVFFGAFTLSALLLKYGYVGTIPASTFRTGIVIFYLGGIAFLYWAFMRLKRVEMDGKYVYVTNYFKSVRYPYHNIEKIKYNDYFLFRSASVLLRQPGIFGSKLTFIPSRTGFRQFLDEHPEVKQQVMVEE